MLKRLRNTYFVSIFAALWAVNNILFITPSFGDFYYVGLGVVLLLVLIKSAVHRFDTLLGIFVLACVSSILFNTIPEFFSPWLRFGTFMVIIVLFSPLIGSKSLYRFRCETFVAILYLLMWVTIISFFAYLLGVNAMATRVIAEQMKTMYTEMTAEEALLIAQTVAGGQSGITVQSMVMGPVAAASLCFTVYKLFVEDRWKAKPRVKLFYVFAALCAFIMVLMSASRIALVSAACGLMTLVLLKEQLRFGRTAKWLLGVIAVMVVTFPLWEKYTETVQQKNKANVEAGGMFNSREELWETRIEEFKTSPITGIGFASATVSDDKVTNWTGTDTASGRVESGTSWLVVLSMTGLFGFIPFVCKFLSTFGCIKKHVVKQQVRKPWILVGSLLALFSVHMLAEGYILAGGSFMCLFVWLILGVADALPRMKFEKIEL